jgi:hypothetical protein
MTTAITKQSGTYYSAHAKPTTVESKDEKKLDNNSSVSNGKFIWVQSEPGSPEPLPNQMRQGNRTLALPQKEKTIIRTMKNGKKRKVMTGVTDNLPPPFNATTHCRIHRRFRANSTGTSTTVTLGSLIGSLGVVGTVTNTTCVSMFSSVRLEKIVMWPPQNAGSDRTILEWGASADGGYSPDDAFINTVPDGITVTTGISFRPPRKSLLNNWMSTYLTASNIIAYVTCPTGTIIDVHVVACQPNDFVPESITVATAVVGSVYYLSLDPSATNVFIPVGLVSTH